MRLTPEFPKESAVTFAYGSRQQPEATTRIPAFQEQAPGALPWGREGVSQLRPPAVPCRENVQACEQPAQAQALRF